jgi:hypothetical protein
MGNDVVPSSRIEDEYAALCAVAEAADEEHRTHCLLLTSTCPLCHALAALDEIRQAQQVRSN